MVVIYINLREADDHSGFPMRDDIPSQILTRFPPTKWEYQIVCYVFFIALFEALDECLTSTRENVMDWVRNMCDLCGQPGSLARTEFFEKVKAMYAKVK